VVDVIRRWGPPGSVKQSGSDYLLRWESGMLVYAAGRHFHYQLPVTRIVFRLSDE